MRTRTSWGMCICLMWIAGFWPVQAQAQDSRAQKVTRETVPTVRVAYLVPSDRRFRTKYRAAVKHAIRNVEAWYQDELANGETFRLSHPAVKVVRTNHSAAYYSTTPVNGSNASLWFWFNALADAFAATGGQFYDPNHRWVFYIDADVACGQVIGGAAGVALLAANDLRGLTGQANVPACPDEPPDTGGVCRWVGGLGHELGHTFGLEHPTPCPGGADDAALMCLGYITYPDAYLTLADQATLDVSPFFSHLKLHALHERRFGCD